MSHDVTGLRRLESDTRPRSLHLDVIVHQVGLLLDPTSTRYTGSTLGREGLPATSRGKMRGHQTDSVPDGVLSQRGQNQEAVPARPAPRPVTCTTGSGSRGGGGHSLPRASRPPLPGAKATWTERKCCIFTDPLCLAALTSWMELAFPHKPSAASLPAPLSLMPAHSPKAGHASSLEALGPCRGPGPRSHRGKCSPPPVLSPAMTQRPHLTFSPILNLDPSRHFGASPWLQLCCPTSFIAAKTVESPFK